MPHRRATSAPVTLTVSSAPLLVGDAAVSAARDLMRAGIASTTRQSYDTGVRNYQLYLEAAGWPSDPDSVTAERLVCWIAARTAQGTVRQSTLRVYCAAINEWLDTCTTVAANFNPGRHPSVRRALDGAERVKMAWQQ